MKERERRASLLMTAEANREALRLTTIGYESGLSNYLEVLDAQRSLYASEDALVQNRGMWPPGWWRCAVQGAGRRLVTAAGYGPRPAESVVSSRRP